MMIWCMLREGMKPEHLGLIPSFLSDEDPRPAAEQIRERYVAGWTPFRGFEMNPRTLVLQYPGDPPTRPLAMSSLRDELLVFYEREWLAVVQRDRSFEIARLD